MLGSWLTDAARARSHCARTSARTSRCAGSPPRGARRRDLRGARGAVPVRRRLHRARRRALVLERARSSTRSSPPRRCPGLLPPVEIGGEHFIDGGIVNSIPIGRAVELGADEIYVLHVGRIDRPLEVAEAAAGRRASSASRSPAATASSASWPRSPRASTVHVLPTGEPDPPRWNELSSQLSRNFKDADRRIRESPRGDGRDTSTRDEVARPAALLVRRLVVAPLVVLVCLLFVVLGPLLLLAAFLVDTRPADAPRPDPPDRVRDRVRRRRGGDDPRALRPVDRLRLRPAPPRDRPTTPCCAAGCGCCRGGRSRAARPEDRRPGRARAAAAGRSSSSGGMPGSATR